MIMLILLMLILSVAGGLIGIAFKLTFGLLKFLLIIPAVIGAVVGIFVLSLPVIGVIAAAGLIYLGACALTSAKIQ